MYRGNAFSKIFRPVVRVYLGCLLLILLLTMAVACDDRKEIIDVMIAGEVFKVEVVRGSEEKALGLMHRKKLGPREGMLFVYSRDRRLAFWMKDTIVPLSIAFLSSGAEITQIERMKPLDLTPVKSVFSVRYALEVTQGAFVELGVAEGDRVEFPQGFR